MAEKKKRPGKKMAAEIQTTADETTGMYEAVLKNTSTGLHIYRLEDAADDKSLRMVFVNPAGAAIVGMKPEAMTGRLMLEIFPCLEKDGIHSSCAAVVNKGKGFQVSDFFYEQPGLPGAWYSFNAFPLPGRRMGVLFENITKLKIVSTELSLFRKLVDHSNDAIFVVDPATGAFIDVNHTACLRLGYPRKTMLRMGVKDIQETASTPEQWRDISSRVSKGTVLVEVKHRRADGTVFPAEVSISRAEVEGRSYFLASARDITERKKMEEAVKEVDTLRGLIPICANCKKIRDDKGFWQRVEVYLEERSTARFTHGLCQDCMKNLYGKEKWFREKDKKKQPPSH